MHNPLFLDKDRSIGRFIGVQYLPIVMDDKKGQKRLLFCVSELKPMNALVRTVIESAERSCLRSRIMRHFPKTFFLTDEKNKTAIDNNAVAERFPGHRWNDIRRSVPEKKRVG